VVVAIDGPSGVGKSTVTRAVAAEIGIPYFDTGATYRAATLAVLRSGVDPRDADSVVDVVRRSAITYEDGVIHLDGSSVESAVRSAEVTAAVSAVSTHPAVREIMVDVQRRWVTDHGGAAVVEGRDIGSVVFPDAPVKVFLTAPPEVRAARRAGDPEAAGASVGTVVADLVRRDHIDSTRETSPLRAAEDAVVLNTESLDAGEVVEAVLALIRQGERTDRNRG
jgi:cytidylate kinase